MWWSPLYVVIIALLLYLSAATAYLLLLALTYPFASDPKTGRALILNRFAILVPAHDEELLIADLCESLLKIDYPHGMFEIFIVADNCTDKTAETCKTFPVNVLERSDPARPGKGYAIDWALRHIPLGEFDAVFMVDADNIVDPAILTELNVLLNEGEQAIQCNNSVRNRDDSWFTQLLFVSRTIGNHLYHHSKYKLGLSSYLMGNGLCFTSRLLAEKGWTAFSTGEDWEYYALLVRDRVRIGFAVKAKVFHQESRSLKQATSQRLRWSSGRFHVARKLGLPLFFNGLRRGDLFTLDASLPLIFPNYSLQINLTLIILVACFLLPTTPLTTLLMATGVVLIAGQLLLFLMGVFISGSPWKVFKAALKVPWFLAWKMVIDLLCITGIYKGKDWVRTERHVSPTEDVLK
jgi:cellulose synthase/poly-beta-1,6-N-acetylglucosamine synthase-like glycosyltransferase